MKVIDLLVKNANGEEMPNKINYDGHIYIFDIEYNAYINQITKSLLGCDYKLDRCLNDEVEIIEGIEKPKKIEYIKKNQNRNDKINEIIYSVNYLLEKSKDDEI